MTLIPQMLLYVPTETGRLVIRDRGAQGGHLDFHTAPELCSDVHEDCSAEVTNLFTPQVWGVGARRRGVNAKAVSVGAGEGGGGGGGAGNVGAGAVTSTAKSIHKRKSSLLFKGVAHKFHFNRVRRVISTSPFSPTKSE